MTVDDYEAECEIAKEADFGLAMEPAWGKKVLLEPMTAPELQQGRWHPEAGQMFEVQLGHMFGA